MMQLSETEVRKLGSPLSHKNNTQAFPTENIRIILCASDYTPGDKKSVNIQTEGLTKLLKMPELQLTVPLSKKYIFKIFDTLINGFSQGKSIKENTIYELIEGYPKVMFKYITDSRGEKFLRIIMPDPVGQYPLTSDIVPYNKQLEPEPYLSSSFKRFSLIVLRGAENDAETR